MKKLNLRYIATFLLLLPLCLSANQWNTPDKGNFTGQTNIVNMNHSETKAMAAVCYGDQVWYFSNVQKGGKGQISLRKLTNTGTSGTVKWTQKETSDITHLNDLGNYDWQPAAVVFNNVLYLFVGNKSNGISYSYYNDADSSWSALTPIPAESDSKLGFGMAAAVVGNRLCLVYQNFLGFIIHRSSIDLVNWTYVSNEMHRGVHSSSNAAVSKYGALSAISRSYIENGKQKSVLKYAYINSNKIPHAVTCSFDTTGWNYTEISDHEISTERTYQSVALIDGTVHGDSDSKGHCNQAFLKLDHKDNGYCRYRIQRWQSKEGGSWTKQENNLVKQNYLWARELTNLCAVNFGVANKATNMIEQYMCLIYTAYNDAHWPLACAYAKTDHLVYDPIYGITRDTLVGPKNTQYIGYIEGAAPFHLNNKGNVDDDYLNPEAEPISALEFESSESQSHGSELGFDVSGKVNVSAACLKAGLSGSFGQMHGSEYNSTISNTTLVKASEDDSVGYYIILQPIISRAFYKIYDVHNTLIDSTYYYFMTKPYMQTIKKALGQDLKPSDPETYFNRPINFAAYTDNNYSYGDEPVSWTTGVSMSCSISIDSTKKNTTSVSLGLSAELGEIFNIGFDGSLDYSITNTTNVGNKVSVYTSLNSAHDSADITKIEYVTYWLKPIKDGGTYNWWLHEGAQDQPTWCITYDVTYIEYMHGNSIGSEFIPEAEEPVSEEPISEETESNMDQESDEPLSPTEFSLAQNYPNPFKPYTVIKYQIGIEDPQTDIENQGYQTRLAVYNLSGHQVALIVDEYKTAGSYEVNFDASQLTPGVYFYSLQSGSFRDIKKFILLK